MPAYAWVPYATEWGGRLPSAEDLNEFGLNIGGNTLTRSDWVMSVRSGPCKIAAVRPSNPEYHFLSVVYAYHHDNDYPDKTYCRAVYDGRELIAGSPHYVYASQLTTSGNIDYNNYMTAGQLVEQNCNIPIYDTVAAALAAMDDGIWDGGGGGGGEVEQDPYEDGGYSDEGGGGGDFTNPSDNMPVPSLPTASVYDTGFMTIFTPTKQELYNLAGYMWSSLFSVESFKKLFADPMDAILGMSIVPVTVPNDGQKNVVVGNISTGVSMTVAKQQYVEVDCGTINVTEYWGSYLDYEPYVTADIVLPYIGTHPISADEIVGHMVGVKYHIDVLSGACVAFVTRDTDVLYTFAGQCAISVPICSNDWTNVINGALGIAAAIGSMVATGGMTAPVVAGGIASTAINQSKPSIERSGALGGAAGILGMQIPYIILTRPKQALPLRQNMQIGYPSYMTATLGTLTGYTQIDSIHLEGIPATREELDEIETLLKEGVIL